MAILGSGAGTDDRPEGQPLACPTPPKLTSAHNTRLRSLWGYGRPVHVFDVRGVDLDLVVHGLVEFVDDRHSSGAVLNVTKRGVVHLNEIRQAVVNAQQPHHDLGRRLCAHLRAKGLHTWENIAFSNPDRHQGRRWGVVRPDVFACKPELIARNAAPAIYEVKVSRADFVADLAKPEKRAAYADLAEAVYYCCPDGLIDKADVPDGFGLVCELEMGRFELVKKARRAKAFVLAVDTAMTLMVKRQVPLSDLD